AAASDEGAQALARMQLPPGLQAKLWAAEPMLANPVAFNFDERGRIFVTETYRYRTSVLDIRDYMGILEEDLACRTIEDRAALIRRAFGAAGERELGQEGEVIRLLADTDGDGVADRSSVYADGFNHPLDGIASGVLARRGEVYFTNIPSLWKFTGAERAETRTELSRGYGVRFNFTGHDLHGLIFGPDGRLYFSNGDRGATVRTREGKVLSVPDEGAVFRCWPDGSQLEVFATGLRNPQSLVFNELGDLFTGDNDCDQGDEERFVHVLEGGDSGWRVGYQFAPLGKAGPWNLERLWHPRHEGQPAYLVPPLFNLEDGPSGLEYYPGTGLNPAYRGHFFITHFKGAVASSGIHTYTLKPRGASYEVATAQPFLRSALPTDVKFGPDGRLYTADWADGWPKSRRGRIYAISDPKHAQDPLVRETQALIGGDWTRRSATELARLLGHADWRVRLEAQFELAGRGDTATLEATLEDTSRPETARRHALWALGQVGARQPAALTAVRNHARHAEPAHAELRAQALRVLGDVRAAADAPLFLEALEAEPARVRYFAAQGLGKLRHAPAAGALFAALKRNQDADAALRHALVMGLTGGANLAALRTATHDASPAIRLGALLALRRLGRPEVVAVLQDKNPALVREAAIAINDVPIAEGYVALAALLDTPTRDEPVLFRALNAHFRLGHPANANALAAYAARADAPPRARAEALAQLAQWPKPLQRDRLVGVYRPTASPTRDRSVATQALPPGVPRLCAPATPAEGLTAALQALPALELEGATATLLALLGDEARPAASRVAALQLLDRRQDPRLAEAVRVAGASQDPTLRLAALPLATRLAPETAVPVLTALVERGTPAEQKAAFRSLGFSRQEAADDLIAAQLRALATGKVAPEAELELLNAAERRNGPAVKDLLAARTARLAADPDPLAAFHASLAGGDAERGRRVFENQPVLACIRCHRAGGEGGDAGPNLAGLGARASRRELLESILKPNAKISAGYDTVVVTLRSGGTAAGIVAAETGTTLTLRNAENQLVPVAKADIARRDGAPSGMPEIYATLLSPAELRDVVEYLASLRGESRPATNQPRALRGPPPAPRAE
ncbi:MAG: DUF7133 domain-containing protein, partial [Opitutaceae bacterium]